VISGPPARGAALASGCCSACLLSLSLGLQHLHAVPDMPTRIAAEAPQATHVLLARAGSEALPANPALQPPAAHGRHRLVAKECNARRRTIPTSGPDSVPSSAEGSRCAITSSTRVQRRLESRVLAVLASVVQLPQQPVKLVRHRQAARVIDAHRSDVRDHGSTVIRFCDPAWLHHLSPTPRPARFSN
jgi:hypothetical protein